MQRSTIYSLFHDKTLEKRMLSFGFPKNLSDRLQSISKWVTYIQSGNFRNPVSDAEYLHDLCVDVLGYRSPFIDSNKTWELEFTPTTALGFFGGLANYVLVEVFIGDIQTKPQINYETTAWIIVTDYKYIRLYARHRIQAFYEQFELENLITNADDLKRFYFMLCRRTLLAANSQEQSRLSKLLIESEELVQEVINNFYQQYHKIRGQLIKDFSYRLQLLSSTTTNLDSELNLEQPEIDLMAIAKTQKLLNRIIFITYCQDHKLLPTQLMLDAYEFSNPYINQPIWENYKAIFSWINKGNMRQSVFGYGGSLFEYDQILDELLFVGDELCRQIKELTRFDFDNDISGLAIAYILEELNKDLVLKNQSSTKRKKLKYPTKILQIYESIENIIQSHLYNLIQSTANENIDTWILHKLALENLKIYVPECGSGIFLVMGLDILIKEYQQVYHQLNLESELIIPLKILQNQIYGGDRYSESVEITKLNLWLYIISPNQVLDNLDRNIHLGNTPDFQEVIDLAQTTGNLVILK